MGINIKYIKLQAAILLRSLRGEDFASYFSPEARGGPLHSTPIEFVDDAPSPSSIAKNLKEWVQQSMSSNVKHQFLIILIVRGPVR